jgi:hypothetical protein
MTLRMVRAGVLVVLTLCAAAQSGAADEPTAPNPVLAAMESAYLAAEKDHAKVRAEGFGDGTEAFLTLLTQRVGAARGVKDAPDLSAEVTALAGTSPLSTPSLRVVLARLLPADRGAWPADEKLRESFLAAAREIFADPKFEDCWDKRFGDLPEVVAWRAANVKKQEPPPPPPPPGPSTPPGPGPGPENPTPGPGPEKPPDTPPGPGPEKPPQEPRPSFPRPDDPNPLANLVPLESTRGWVGPWTGYTTEIPEKDNKRQKRAAKHVWIDRYEVTCDEYLVFVKGLEPAKRRAMLPGGWPMGEDLEPTMPPSRERTPVTNVTYAQAAAYAASVGKRLPTEDEWDRAAGGGEKDGRQFPWGPSAEGR